MILSHNTMFLSHWISGFQLGEIILLGLGLSFFVTDVHFSAAGSKWDPFIFNWCSLRPEVDVYLGLSFMMSFFIIMYLFIYFKFSGVCECVHRHYS